MSDELKTFIGEKMGEATMCWEPIPSGVFDSQRATKILDEVYSAVEQHIQQVELAARKDELHKIGESFLTTKGLMWIIARNQELKEQLKTQQDTIGQKEDSMCMACSGSGIGPSGDTGSTCFTCNGTGAIGQESEENK